MKISLYLIDEIINFILPTQIAGSFSFDKDQNEENKLINVEARDGKWILYSTEDVSVLNNNQRVPYLNLTLNNFYFIQRDNKNFLIYTSPTLLSNYDMYVYKENINLLIGNNNQSNIQYLIPYLNNIQYSVIYQNQNLIFQKTQNALVYVNKKAIKETKYVIKIGDEIEIYGLRIFFLNGFVFINKISDKVIINEQMSNLIKYVFPRTEQLKNIEVKDNDLYDKSEYFSKSPRLRRLIEKKDIKFASPPNDIDLSSLTKLNQLQILRIPEKFNNTLIIQKLSTTIKVFNNNSL